MFIAPTPAMCGSLLTIARNVQNVHSCFFNDNTVKSQHGKLFHRVVFVTISMLQIGTNGLTLQEKHGINKYELHGPIPHGKVLLAHLYLYMTF
jgi:hypothetical protein